MKTITLTISISVPDDVEVDVKTETVDSSLPKPIRVQRSRDLTVPTPTPPQYAPKPWTPAEDAFVRDTELTAVEIATVLERTVGAIRHRRYELGINISGKTRTLAEAPAAMRRWSQEEDDALLRLGHHLVGRKQVKREEFEEIAETMGRSVEAVRHRFKLIVSRL